MEKALRIGKITTKIPFLINNGILVISLFFLTLSSIYFNQIGFNIIQVIGALLLVIISRKYFTFKNMNMFIFCVFMIFLSISTFWGTISFISTVQLKGLFGFMFGCFVFLYILSVEGRQVQRIFTAFNIVLFIHVVLWIIQFSIYFINHQFIDFIQPITGISTRNFYDISGYYVIRFSGLFLEPGMYATFMFMGLYVRYLRNDYKLKLFDILIIITMLFSFSTFGYFLLLSFSLIFILTNINKKLIGFILVLSTVLSLFIYFFPNEFNIYFMQRLTNPTADSSGQVRLVDSINFFLNELPFRGIIFGVGLGNYEMTSGVANGIIYLLQQLGIIGTIIFLGLVLSVILKGRGIPNIIAFFAIVLGGAPFTDLYWWLWLGLISVNVKSKLKDEYILKTIKNRNEYYEYK